MRNMMNLVKQAQQMKKSMEDLQKKMEDMEMEGAAGGLVTAVVNGKNMVRRIRIDPKAMEDRETLEDLVAAAINDAQGKMQAYVQNEVGKVTGGMQLPGF